MVDRADLDVSADELARPAGDLDDMRRRLDGQVRRMDATVDRIEARWRREASGAGRAWPTGCPARIARRPVDGPGAERGDPPSACRQSRSVSSSA
ncbi:hypothetical protein ACIOJD_05205 [Streptomyces sp. NPDC088116]|uniref:hypothetical protein n=1 Tax=Streptomyces sp. NPDC088116 TaxID=3365825 RepID=UPI003826CFAB